MFRFTIPNINDRSRKDVASTILQPMRLGAAETVDRGSWLVRKDPSLTIELLTGT
jgi:hypothetical protein